MSKISSTATRAEINKILDGFIVMDEPVDTQYAVMGYLGMCHYRYMSSEWLIAQFVWEECINKLSESEGETVAQTIKNRIEELYQDKAYFINMNK